MPQRWPVRGESIGEMVELCVLVMPQEFSLGPAGHAEDDDAASERFG